MKKIPVGATISHAYGFGFGDFFKILGVMWLPMVMMWLPGILLQSRLTALSAQTASQDFSGLRQLWPVLVPFYLIALILMFMQIVGVAELALGRRTGPAWFYFSFRKPVWRLIGSFLLLLVIAIAGGIAAALGGVVLTGLTIGVSKLAGGGVWVAVMTIVTGLGGLAIWCGYLYCFVRFAFLLVPVVVAEEKSPLERSWRLGKGNFWRAFVVILAILVPFLALEFFFLFAFLFKGIPNPPPNASPEQLAGYQAAMNAQALQAINGMNHYWYITYPLFMAVFVIVYGTSIGAQCFAYRALTEDEASAAIAFD